MVDRKSLPVILKSFPVTMRTVMLVTVYQTFSTIAQVVATYYS